MWKRKFFLEVLKENKKKILYFRVIYWIDWGVYFKIEKLNYDGLNCQIFIDSGFKFFNGFVYDGISKYFLFFVIKKIVKIIWYIF